MANIIIEQQATFRISPKFTVRSEGEGVGSKCLNSKNTRLVKKKLYGIKGEEGSGRCHLDDFIQ